MKALFTQVELILGLVPGFLTIYVAQLSMPLISLVQRWMNSVVKNLRA